MIHCIQANLIPLYVITGFITIVGLVGVITNVFLERYYAVMKELTLNLLPKQLRLFRIGTLWTARIGSILLSWVVLLHCFIETASLSFIPWGGFGILLVVIEVIILINVCDTFSKNLPENATYEDRILYNRSVEHALYAIGSPLVTIAFMVVLTLIGHFKLW